MKNSEPAQANRITDMAQDARPREKALKTGIKSLSDIELMAILFSTGIKGKNVLQLCEEILRDNGFHLSKVARFSATEFKTKYSGIGIAKALTLLAALELGARAAADAIRVDDPQMSSSELVYNYTRDIFSNLVHEEFWILLLRQDNRVIKPVKIGQGGLASTAVDIRVIMRESLAANASAIILLHNHPSGNLKPSQQDINLTKKISDGAKLLDLRVLDHVVVSPKGFYSFNDHGMMP